MTTKKCPKCNQQDFQLIDYYVTGYIYDVVNGYVTANGADDGGRHVKSRCFCRICGHVWSPRHLDSNFRIDE